MKSFRFPLETVLEARRTQETEARRQLAGALARQHEAVARSFEATRALELLLETIANASQGRFSVADRERSAAVGQAQERICAELRVAAQECARLSDEKRAVMLEARRNRELLERFRESRHDAWQKEAARAEEHLLDEFAMTRRFQTSQQTSALC